MPSFSEMARVKVDDLPEVKLMPRGSYYWQIIKQAEVKPTANQKQTMIAFPCKCMGPIPDFDGDTDELEAFGTPSNVMTLRFFYPEVMNDDEDESGLANRQAAAMERLTKFLIKDLGIEDGNTQQMLAQVVGRRFLGTIRHTPDSRDTSRMQADWAGTAPIE